MTSLLCTASFLILQTSDTSSNMETLVSISEAEEKFCYYKLGMAGSGITALINAVFALDKPNREKISMGFPELVDVVNRYNYEMGYWEDLRERWNQYHHQKLD